MKILKIEFQNINSLRGKHEIDFTKEPFITNSLFAITGPTGSGKSTILDVISLALFNQVPRLGKITKNEILAKGAILTRNQKEALAAVTYECKHGIFRSQWSISTNRNNKLRDYEMEITDLDSGKLFDLKKSDVPSKNEDLIGLSYDQFIKAVLLAQGEFAQFLRAKKEERGELLEKITGTGIYRLLGIKAFEKNKEANLNIQNQQREILIIQQNLLEENVIEKHSKDLSDNTKNCDGLQEEIERLKKTIELKNSLVQKRILISETSKKNSLGKIKLQDFETRNGNVLVKHEKVQDLAEDLRNWKSTDKEILILTKEVSELEVTIVNNRNLTTKLLEAGEHLIHKNIEEEKFSEELDLFRNKIQELIDRKKEKGSQYNSEKNLLISQVRELNFNINEQDFASNFTVLETIQSKASEKIQIFSKELHLDKNENLVEYKTKLKEKIKRSRDANKEFLIIERKREENTKIKLEIEVLLAEKETLPDNIEKLKLEENQLRTNLENLQLKKENEKLKASLSSHRHELQDGNPCPLCGSLHHPFADDLPEKDETLEKQFQKVKTAHQEKFKELNTIQYKLKEIEAKLDKLVPFNEQTKEEYISLNKIFSINYSDLPTFKNSEEWETNIYNLETSVEKLEELQKFNNELKTIQNIFPLLKNLESILAEGRLIKKDLEKLYTGNSIQQEVQELQGKWIRNGEEFKNLTQRMRIVSGNLSVKCESQKDLKTRLDREFKKREIPSIQAGYAFLLPESEILVLRNEKGKIQKEIDQARTTLKLLEEQLEELVKLDSLEDKETVSVKLQEKQTLYLKVREECNELNRIIKNHQENLQRLDKLKSEIFEKEKLTRRWRLLNELIGDSKGKIFNDFAQDLTLSRLIKLANIRLHELSDRYLIDKPMGEEDDSLVAIDEHMGGQRRSVKTLSGGETFILSLSMALALSDLASKNVEINSLFIDEGFGTLDPETLDQTLDTLERLQAETSKTIGVISHVDSLKERISTQIQLSRNGQGYSTLIIK